jgi:hypothetical protein
LPNRYGAVGRKDELAALRTTDLVRIAISCGLGRAATLSSPADFFDQRSLIGWVRRRSGRTTLEA